MTASLREIRVFTTFPHQCSYLPEQEATTLFVDPRQAISPTLYTQLSMLGFRRSGEHIYRPHCSRCNACVASRIPVKAFQISRSQRRVLSKNQDLSLVVSDSIFDDEAWDLYSQYIEHKHKDGDMYPPDREQYESFLKNGLACTDYFRIYAGKTLLAVSVVDTMVDGLAAIYTFYHPDHEHRSLGTYCVLQQVEQARLSGLDYVYLGYWIADCRKMNYKSRFQPLELLKDGHWQTLQNNG